MQECKYLVHVIYSMMPAEQALGRSLRRWHQAAGLAYLPAAVRRNLDVLRRNLTVVPCSLIAVRRNSLCTRNLMLRGWAFLTTLAGWCRWLSEGCVCYARSALEYVWVCSDIAYNTNYTQMFPNTFWINESAIPLIQNAIFAENRVKMDVLSSFDQWNEDFVDRKFP